MHCAALRTSLDAAIHSYPDKACAALPAGTYALQKHVENDVGGSYTMLVVLRHVLYAWLEDCDMLSRE